MLHCIKNHNSRGEKMEFCNKTFSRTKKKLSIPDGSQTQLLSVNDHSGDDDSARNHQHLETPGQVAVEYSQV